jgi:hypothetical protein
MLTRSAAPVASVKDLVSCLSMPVRHTGDRPSGTRKFLSLSDALGTYWWTALFVGWEGNGRS